jgi:hypothetical protein
MKVYGFQRLMMMMYRCTCGEKRSLMRNLTNGDF